MRIGFWDIPTEELEEILSHYHVKLKDIDLCELKYQVNESLKDPRVGGGDPWRMGAKFHIERALRVMKTMGFSSSGEEPVLKPGREEYEEVVREWILADLSGYLQENYFLSYKEFNFDVFETYLKKELDLDPPYMFGDNFVSVKNNTSVENDPKTMTKYREPENVCAHIVKRMNDEGVIMKMHNPPTQREQESYKFHRYAGCCPEADLRASLEYRGIKFADFNIEGFAAYFKKQDWKLMMIEKVDNAVQQMVDDDVCVVKYYVPSGSGKTSNSKKGSRGNSYASVDSSDYRPLTRDERLYNLSLILQTILFTALLIALTVWMYSGDYLDGKGVFIGPACTLGVVARMFLQYEHRFSSRYNITRLLVCAVALFSTLIYHTAYGLYWLICRIAEVDRMGFALFICTVCIVIKIVCYIWLNRTSDVHTAKIIGWIQALAVAFFFGTFFFGCMAK